MLDRQQRSGGNVRVYREFTSPVRRRGGGGEKQMKQGSVGSSAGSSGSVLAYPKQKKLPALYTKEAEEIKEYLNKLYHWLYKHQC